jgi:hypothetical protein
MKFYEYAVVYIRCMGSTCKSGKYYKEYRQGEKVIAQGWFFFMTNCFVKGNKINETLLISIHLTPECFNCQAAGLFLIITKIPHACNGSYLKYIFRVCFGNFSIPAIKQIVHEKGYFLVQAVSRNIKPDKFMDQCIRFGIWTDTDTEPAVRSDGFPV